MIMPNQQSTARLTCQQPGEFQLIISGDQSNFNSSAERKENYAYGCLHTKGKIHLSHLTHKPAQRQRHLREKVTKSLLT